MEEDIDYSKPSLLKARLKKVIVDATERQRYEAAHNSENLRALGIVHDFIKRHGRVCYGGTAMNAILPSSKQFYSPDYDLPDYDFFTPTVDSDVKALLKDLAAAGFTEIYHKIGIHEGTMKVMVNFVPIADITSIPQNIYDIYHKRTIVKNGIHYTDPDMLRMMMYLELSRPKGQVDRWEKVFERLTLINDAFPMKRCKTVSEPQDARIIHDFIIASQRILCSAPISLYAKGIKGRAVFSDTKGPVIFASPSAREDAADLKRYIGGAIYLHKGIGEAPERIEVRQKGVTVAIIVSDSACHSYYQVPTTDGRIILIGSLEFLITLYLSLNIFTGFKGPCIRSLIDLSKKNYVSKSSAFPPLSIHCRGYQIGFASLLRNKMERIKKTRKNRD